MPESGASLIFTRQHPEYAANKAMWARLKLAYSGGEDYIKEALIRHISELLIEFEERLKRAYFLNYVRRIPARITEFVLAVDPVRAGADEDIVEDFDRFGNRINTVMRQWEILTLLFGVSWMLVDSPAVEFDESGVPVSKDIKQKKDEKLRPYGMALDPLLVEDWNFANDGELEWAKIISTKIEATDPFTEPKKIIIKTLWTRETWQTFSQVEGSAGIETGEEVAHNLGAVPLIRRLRVDTTGLGAKHWMNDILRITDAILNNESEAQINIVKQVFGLLVVPESFTNKAADIQPQSKTTKVAKGETWGKALSRSFAVSEEPEESGITRYVSPDGVITDAIEKSNDRLKREIFDIIGLAIKEETSQVESADSKAWDNQAVNAFLQTEADSMEEAENKTWVMFNKWDSSIKIPEVKYNRDFNIQEFKEAMLAISEIMSLEVGEKFQRRVMKTALNMLNRIESIGAEEKDAILKEIDEMEMGSIAPME